MQTSSTVGHLLASTDSRSLRSVAVHHVGRIYTPTLPLRTSMDKVARAQTTRSMALRATKQSPSTPSQTSVPSQLPRTSSTASLLPLAGLLAALATDLLLAPMAHADDMVVGYDPSSGAEGFKTIAGIGYIILVIIYFARLFKKRASKATSERLASSSSAEDDSDDEEKESAAATPTEQKETTPIACFIGSLQAGAICYLLFLCSSAVDGYFDKQTLPSAYTARNIAVLVQTVVRGLAYLITFIFGANTVGLGALGVQLLIFPDSLAEQEGRKPAEDKFRLPKVSISSDYGDIKRAFKEAEELGRRQAEKERKNK